MKQIGFAEQWYAVLTDYIKPVNQFIYVGYQEEVRLTAPGEG